MKLEKPRQIQEWREGPYDSWTHSKLNTMLNICGMQYWLRYQKRIPAETLGAEMLIGGALDVAVFKPYYMLLKEGKTPDMDRLRSDFEDEWDRKAADPKVNWEKDTPEGWAATGLRIIDTFEKKAPPLKTQMTDFRFCVPLVFSDGTPASERPLKGEVDLVAADDGRILLLDFKTSGRKPSEWELDNDFQSMAYTYAFGQIFPKSVGSIDFLWHYYYRTAKGGFDSFQRTRTQAHQDAFMRLIQQADRMIDEKLVVPRRVYNFSCAGCGVRTACDQWIGGELAL